MFIERVTWDDCIRRCDRPHTSFYLDPPYWGIEGYGVAFGLEQYDKMAQLARSIKGKMIVLVNDIPEMRKVFDGLVMEFMSIDYTVGGGEKRKPAHELIIRNFE